MWGIQIWHYNLQVPRSQSQWSWKHMGHLRWMVSYWEIEEMPQLFWGICKSLTGGLFDYLLGNVAAIGRVLAEHGGFFFRTRDLHATHGVPTSNHHVWMWVLSSCNWSSSMEKRRVLEFPYFRTHPDVNSENLQVAQSKMNCGFVSWHRERMWVAAGWEYWTYCHLDRFGDQETSICFPQKAWANH